ncbi:hypothetical protein CO614_08810 [Lysobacteraceae bacterium NML120232]|nr:hypothetical protein CO614_08810 [Xanthomonadaceae bacterium NML120232]
MSSKKELRLQRKGTIINKTSKRQESELNQAITSVIQCLEKNFPKIKLTHSKHWLLIDIISSLQKSFPNIEFHTCNASSSMKPDGGILSLLANNGKHYPILIAEKKNQGTNDLRANEGKKKQAKGNAIERLGKNVIGFRTALLEESIFPFVCFGDGCDFSEDSSILDRVVTIAMFGKLNTEYLHNQNNETFNRGTFYFREKHWTEAEMRDHCYSIAKKSIYYYFSKYGESTFYNDV